MAFKLSLQPFNSLVYDIIGDDSAATYFAINSLTGAITLRNTVGTDTATRYFVSCLELYDPTLILNKLYCL